MTWVRRVLGVLIVSVGLSSVAWAEFNAQGGGPISDLTALDPVICRTDGGCNNLITGPVKIKGYKHLAGAANSQMALWDAVTVPQTAGAGQANDPKDEHFEATANETAVHIYPGAITYTTAVSVGMSGTGSITYVYL